MLTIFDNNQFIGYVSDTNPAFIKVHFPSSVLLNKYFQEGTGLHSGIVGNYVLIEGEDHGFLAKIIEVSLPEKERLDLTQMSFQSKDFHPTGRLELLLCFDYNNHFCTKGFNQFPGISSKVYSCPDTFLSILLKDFGKKPGRPDPKLLDLATLPTNTATDIKLSGQALLARHCAIVGSTGGGKSFTVARLTGELIKHNGKTILIDATGEYANFKKVYGEQVVRLEFNSKTETNTYLHYSSLRETDLLAMFRPSGQSQLPKLQDALKSLRLVHLIQKKEDKTANDKHLEGYFQNIAEQDYTLITKENKPRSQFLIAAKENPDVFNYGCNLNILGLPRQIMKECISDFNTDQNNFGSGTNTQASTHCQSLISRILLTLNNKDFNSVFGFDMPEAGTDLKASIDNFLDDPRKFLLIIDTQKVPSDNAMKDILVNAIGRLLLEKALDEKFKQKPLVMILDEAHQFLNKKVKDEYSIEVDLNAFERIAKECRKFGLFLVISTQMPRDIPSGVLSQMGAFIVHRLINQKDREAIEYACSDANSTALSFLPALAAGEALVTGVEFPMPVILKMKWPACPPSSDTPSLFGA